MPTFIFTVAHVDAWVLLNLPYYSSDSWRYNLKGARCCSNGEAGELV